jgi:hypothetical protein
MAPQIGPARLAAMRAPYRPAIPPPAARKEKPAKRAGRIPQAWYPKGSTRLKKDGILGPRGGRSFYLGRVF